MRGVTMTLLVSENRCVLVSTLLVGVKLPIRDYLASILPG
jgi:hypothetical protein